MGYVVDASSLGKLIADEPGADAFRAWFFATSESDAELEAPELLWYEFGRLVQRLLPDEDADVIADIVTAHTMPFHLRRPAPGTAAAYASRGLTFYDAAYVAVAEERGSILVTSDKPMAKVARRSRIPVRFF